MLSNLFSSDVLIGGPRPSFKLQSCLAVVLVLVISIPLSSLCNVGDVRQFRARDGVDGTLPDILSPVGSLLHKSCPTKRVADVVDH